MFIHHRYFSDKFLTKEYTLQFGFTDAKSVKSSLREAKCLAHYDGIPKVVGCKGHKVRTCLYLRCDHYIKNIFDILGMIADSIHKTGLFSDTLVERKECYLKTSSQSQSRDGAAGD